MSLWALVPIKERSRCKTRLRDAMTSDQQRELVCQLLDRVLDVLQHASGVDHVALISRERDRVPTSVELLTDRGAGLNTALADAIETARGRGASAVLIVLPDTALLASADVEALIVGMRERALALAPDRHHSGTNALCQRIAQPLPLSFGHDSFAKHLAEAHRLGLSPAIVRRPGLAFDLDSAADFTYLQHVSPDVAASLRGRPL